MTLTFAHPRLVEEAMPVADAPMEALARADRLGPEVDPRDRRGPMRPETLAPARTRMSGPVVEKSFRLLDGALMLATAAGVLAFADPRAFEAPLSDLAPVLLGLAAVLLSLPPAGAYRFTRREGLSRHLGRLLLAVVIGGTVAWATSLAVEPSPIFARAAGLWFFAAGAALYTAHVGWWLLVRRWRKDGRLTPNVVVVGATPNAARLIESALASGDAAVLGVFDDRALTGRAPDQIGGVPVLGGASDLLGHRILPYVDRIVITVTSSAQARVRQIVEQLRALPNPVTLFVDIDGVDGRSATLYRLADAPLAQISGVERHDGRVLAKRVQDLIFGLAALVVAAPVMALVALAVKLDSPGPVLFRQRRHGFANEEITVWKFRSMSWADRDERASKQVVADDPRVTRVGRFIRRTSLDELPQVFNVLSGEMSLVGPRPHAIGMKTGQVESSRLVAEYAWRHRMKPGVTGWAQINGSRGPVHTAADVRRRVTLDLEYIDRQSFAFDLYILLTTLPRLLGDRAEVR